MQPNDWWKDQILVCLDRDDAKVKHDNELNDRQNKVWEKVRNQLTNEMHERNLTKHSQTERK